MPGDMSEVHTSVNLRTARFVESCSKMKEHLSYTWNHLIFLLTYEILYLKNEFNVVFFSILGFNISEVVEDHVNSFVCTLCGVEFKDKSNCRRHVRSVHMFDQVKCNLCGATLKNQRCLKGHLKTVHHM